MERAYLRGWQDGENGKKLSECPRLSRHVEMAYVAGWYFGQLIRDLETPVVAHTEGEWPSRKKAT